MNDEMKWKLQLFADDEVDNTDHTGGNDPEPEGGKPEKEESEDKKYIDKEVDDIVEKKFARWKAQHENDADTGEHYRRVLQLPAALRTGT